MKADIVVISTCSNGGIKSVVDSYIDSNLSDSFNFFVVSSHSGKSKFYDFFLFLIAYVRTLFCILIGKKIYHLHMSMRGSFYRKAILLTTLKMFNRRVIIHLHGSEFKNFYNESSNLLKSFISRVFAKADSVIVLSQSWMDFVQSISNKAKVIVVNNFVHEISSSKYQPQLDSTTFLFMGKVGDRKGAFDLIRAFANYSEIENSELIMCGDGDVDKAKELVSKLKLNNKIKVVGWVDKAQKAHYYRNSQVVVLPSYDEGLPMTILEAMSCKKIVVSTPVGGIPEVIKDGVNGYLVEPGNLESISKGLIKAAENVDNSDMHEIIYSTYLNYYSPSAILPKIEKLYRELL